VEFRIEPTPLSQRRSRRILGTTTVVVIALGAVIAALAYGTGRPIGIAEASPTSTVSLIATASQPPSSPAPAVAATGPAPTIVCHAIAQARCTAIARAAVTAASDPLLPWPTKVDVWASLLCGSVFDCPPYRLTGRQTAGSAIVLAGTIGLWVNVLEPAAGIGPASSDAWVIRSGPIS
jgi:hypothetical protein